MPIPGVKFSKDFMLAGVFLRNLPRQGASPRALHNLLNFDVSLLTHLRFSMSSVSDMNGFLLLAEGSSMKLSKQEVEQGVKFEPILVESGVDFARGQARNRCAQYSEAACTLGT